MEFNAKFLEDLKKNCKEVSVYDLASAGDSLSSSVFPKLLEMGDKGIMVKVSWNGHTFYSFMSENDMYQEMFGCSKEEHLKAEKLRKEMWESEKEKEKDVCAKAKEEKFEGWIQVLKESFPEEMYLLIKRVTESELEDGHVDRIEKMDKMVSMLELAKTNPEVAKKMYLESSRSANTRLFKYYDLCNSYYGDVFESVIIEDTKQEYGIHGEEFVQKRIKTIQDNIAKAKHEKESQPGDE